MQPITIDRLLNEEQMDGKIRLFGHVTIQPHEALASHEHHGETETYHIISGSGVYNDNGKECPANPGDTFFCADGCSHGISCTSEEPLVFMALIILK